VLYNNLSGYLRNKYGARLKKICIDGGFSCPNRDGKCGTGGCIFCGERGSGEHIDTSRSIGEQVKRALTGARDTDRFIAYFQNFTNTYAPISVLRERYDAALIDDRIVILAIGTRPDCITREVCELIATYKERCDVWVELGLQTADDRVAERINRGYPLKVFDEAVALLAEYEIPTVAHVIIGLPEDTSEGAVNTVRHLAPMKLFGIKIHSIYVSEGTRLADEYRAGRYTPPTLDEYVRCAAECIGYVPEDTVIHRLTGDCPRDMLVAPEWNKSKTAIIDAIVKEMERRGISQGSLL